MPASGDGPRRTTSLEEVVISSSPASEGLADRNARREGQHSTEPLLEGSSPQQHGHWFRHRARGSHTGSEYDPDEQAAPDVAQAVQQPAGKILYPQHQLLACCRGEKAFTQKRKSFCNICNISEAVRLP